MVPRPGVRIVLGWDGGQCERLVGRLMMASFSQTGHRRAIFVSATSPFTRTNHKYGFVSVTLARFSSYTTMNFSSILLDPYSDHVQFATTNFYTGKKKFFRVNFHWGSCSESPREGRLVVRAIGKIANLLVKPERIFFSEIYLTNTNVGS